MLVGLDKVDVAILGFASFVKKWFYLSIIVNRDFCEYAVIELIVSVLQWGMQLYGHCILLLVTLHVIFP